MLSSTVDPDGDIDETTERLAKKIDGCIKINFKKTRIKTHIKNKTEDDLYNKMRALKNKDDAKSMKEMDKVIEALAEVAEKNYETITSELEKVKEFEGKINTNELWKLKKRLCPKSRDPQCAMLDSKGNLLTNEKAIQNRALEVYSNRLKANEMEDNLKELEKDTNTLCKSDLNWPKETRLNHG